MIINYEYPPLGGGGGKACQNLAYQLAQKDHKVHILTAKYKNYKSDVAHQNLRIYTVKSWRKGIHECGFSGAFSFVLFAVPKLSALVRSNSYDIVHYFFSLPTGILSLLPGKIRQIPYIVSLRGSDVPGYDPYNKKVQLFHKMLLPITRRIWRNSKSVIAVCHSLKQLALETASDINIGVIPNGVGEEFFIEGLPKKTSSTFRLVTVSRLIERKGIHHILHAITAFPKNKVELWIVGDGDSKDTLMELCRDLDIVKQVKFYGYVPSKKIPEILNQCDAFVLCSLSEAFGNVFSEAMSTGLPIVGSNIGGIKELVEPENGILIDDISPDAIKDAIHSLMNNPDRRSKMSVLNKQKMRSNYRWQKIADLFIEQYTS